MAYSRDIKDEIESVTALQSLVDAYEEIASTRMKKTRDSVLVNREFLDEIGKIFDEVRRSYINEVKRLARKRKSISGEKITFLAHNGKTVSVLLSSNTGLYGAIVKRTFDLFMDEVRSGSTEVTIAGRHGLALFLDEEPTKPYTFFELPDYNVGTIELSDLIKHIVQYEEIHVFYGKFINVVKQDPTMLSVSAEISLEEEKPKVSEVTYLFEPSLEKILVYFETEIFASLFEQAVRESELAKYASRFLAMDRATGNIKEELKKLEFDDLRVRHGLVNRKQLNSMSNLYNR